MNPKCARLQRLRRAAGCFGEKGPTPNPGRGLRFPARWLPNRHSPHPHPKAAVQNRGLGACRNAPWSGYDEAIASWGVSLLRERPGPARPWTCGREAPAGTTCGTGRFVSRRAAGAFCLHQPQPSARPMIGAVLVPVGNRHRQPLAPQVLPNGLGKGHRPVPPPSAPHSNNQLALPLL